MPRRVTLPPDACARRLPTSGSASRCAGGCRARCSGHPAGWPSWSRSPRPVALGGHRRLLAGGAAVRRYGAAAVSVAGRRAARRAGRGSRGRTSARRPRSTPRPPGAQAGRDADARAYLLIRPYLQAPVRVDVRDPADPTPYWLVSTRHPEQLAAAVRGDRRLALTRPADEPTAAMACHEGARMAGLEDLDRLLPRPRPWAPRWPQEGARHGWKARHRQEPAENPADPDVAIGEAVAWAVVSGASVGLARMLAPRRAADYYRRSDRAPAGRTSRTSTV